MKKEKEIAVKERITPIEIEKEMKSSYIDYAMSVIVGRALPDVRDGLKPVHRRILYAMSELGVGPAKAYKKSARIVGEVMGKYHPHGDVAIYDTIARMCQDFSLRYPLIDGQGNFGSVDGDRPAAMRYTEARLSAVATYLLSDIEKQTINFVPNFDGTLPEPTILPSALPNLLLNGSSGIAVGMATNIPPHNLNEVIDALLYLIDQPQTSLEELMKFLPGPDFPTGGFICGKKGILEAYRTGRGIITLQGRVSTEELERGRSALIVTELPYEVNKSILIENIANLAQEKKIEGISNIRDESDKKGMRICIELKAGENSEVVLNQLYKHTALRTSFGIINLALVKNRPRVLSLNQLLSYYLEHRQEIVRRRTQFDLKKAENRAHILAGLKIALLHIEDVIKLIRKSPAVEAAKSSLMKNFKLSSLQADSILAMPLSRLTKLERDKIDNEHKELTKEIERLKVILSDEKKILGVIKNELKETRKRFGDKRRTKIIAPIGELFDLDFIKKEDAVVTVSAAGYVKRVPVETYHRQHRGGRGIIGAGIKEEDYIKHFFVASTHDTILFFTNKGRVYWFPTYQIPEASRQSKGKAVINLLKISTDETTTAIIPLKEYSDNLFLLMATKKGIVKKTPVSAYSHQRRSGIIALTLKENDELIKVKLTDGKKNIILSTKEGKSIHFAESDIRSMGRTASGVRGIRLAKEDVVRGVEIAEENHFLLTITATVYGKRSKIKLYRKQKRGGKGIIDIKTIGRNGEVVSVKSVQDDDEIMLITAKGILIRVPIKDIRAIGRNTQGVKLINLESGDHIADSALVLKGKEGIPNL